MADAFVGEIRAFSYNISYVPEDWLPCDGRILEVARYQALYSVIGNIYGGQAGKTFALPNLQGQALVGAGQGSDLKQTYRQGASTGANTVTLTAAQMPIHFHELNGQQGAVAGMTNTPSDKVELSRLIDQTGPTAGAVQRAFAPASAVTENTRVTMSARSLTPAGKGASHDNRQPFLALNFYICFNGEYPTRG